MEQQKIQSIIESLLFVHGEPIAFERLAKITECRKEEIQNAVQSLEDQYLAHERGFAILEKDDAIQLVTNPKNAEYVEQLIKKASDEKLSQAGAEVLSIIAYRGPIARNEVEAIRGVNCSYVIRNLLVRGLIERIESEENARIFLYTISFEALRALGINTITDLPDYGSLSQDPRLRSVDQSHAEKEK